MLADDQGSPEGIEPWTLTQVRSLAYLFAFCIRHLTNVCGGTAHLDCTVGQKCRRGASGLSSLRAKWHLQMQRQTSTRAGTASHRSHTLGTNLDVLV